MKNTLATDVNTLIYPLIGAWTSTYVAPHNGPARNMFLSFCESRIRISRSRLGWLFRASIPRRDMTRSGAMWRTSEVLRSGHKAAGQLLERRSPGELERYCGLFKMQRSQGTTS